MSTEHHHPAFKNVQVVATPHSDGTYSYECFPADLQITKRDTIINYQLVFPTPDNIYFTGLDIENETAKVPQFSVPSVSIDRKMITLSDLNTVADTYNVILYLTDDLQKFSFDPQVENIPETP